MKTRRERPYWLRAGDQLCGDCEHGFVRESGFHCGGCDRPLCGGCAALHPVTGELLCLACREAEASVQDEVEGGEH